MNLQDLLDRSEELYRCGHYRQVVDLLRPYLQKLEPAELDETRLDIILEYGRSLLRIGSLQEARRFLEQARKWVETSDSEQLSSRKGQILHQLGYLSGSMHEFNEAEKLLTSAVSELRQAYGQNHKKVADALNDHGWITANRGDEMKALSILEEALSMRAQIFGEEHQDYAETLDTIGIVHSTLGDSVKAISLLRRALDIREKTIGSEHADTALSYNNVATIDNTANKRPLLERSLEICNRELGKDSYLASVVMTNLARECAGEGRYEKAKDLLTKSLSIKERLFGVRSPALLASKKVMLDVHTAEGSDQATILKEELLGDLESAISQGKNDGHDLFLYLDMLIQDNEHEKAAALLQKSIDRCIEEFGSEAIKTAMLLSRKAVLVGSKDAREAREILQQVCEIQRAVLGEDHPGYLESVFTRATYADGDNENSLQELLESVVENKCSVTLQSINVTQIHFFTSEESSKSLPVGQGIAWPAAFGRLEALRAGAKHLDNQHLFLGLLLDGNSSAGKILRSHMSRVQLVSYAEVIARARNSLIDAGGGSTDSDTGSDTDTLPLTRRCMQAILMASWQSFQYKQDGMLSEFLLEALLSTECPELEKCLEQIGTTLEELKASLGDWIKSQYPDTDKSQPYPADNFELQSTYLPALEPCDQISINFMVRISNISTALGYCQPQFFSYNASKPIIVANGQLIDGIITNALVFSQEIGSRSVRREALMYALQQGYGGVAWEVLSGLAIAHDGKATAVDRANEIKKRLYKLEEDKLIKRYDHADLSHLTISTETQIVLARAMADACASGLTHFHSGHILRALVDVEDEGVDRILEALSLSRDEIRQALSEAPGMDRTAGQIWLLTGKMLLSSVCEALSGFGFYEVGKQYARFAVENDANVETGSDSSGVEQPAISKKPAAGLKKKPFKLKSGHLVGGTLLAVLLLKVKSIALILTKVLTFSKLGWVLAKTWTMWLSLVFYMTMFGWKFAITLIVLLYIHEFGHFGYMKLKGLEPNAPVFIPFLGAYVAMDKLPADKMTHALVAYAGPLVGALGALVFLVIGQTLESPFLVAGAYFGFLLNFLQLMPIKPFDGGWIVDGISRWVLIPGVVLAFVVAALLKSVFLMFFGVLGLLRTIRAFVGTPEFDQTDTTLSQKIVLTILYAALGIALSIATIVLSGRVHGLAGS